MVAKFVGHSEKEPTEDLLKLDCTPTTGHISKKNKTSCIMK
jgi:hypothetical protein